MPSQSFIEKKLPEHLRERCRIAATQNAENEAHEGEFVLYWMCTALRADENPAMDAAKFLAKDLELPLLVYHGLSQEYAYASDRLHTFILEGARDVQKDLEERGISYAFHLERPGDSEKHLKQLVESSRVTITEDMPTHAPKRFLKALQSSCSTPILAVNTACVVSPTLVGKAYDRAFAYRNKTRKLYSERVTRAWPKCDIEVKKFDLNKLDFEPLDLQKSNLADLVASCEIDHTIGPVLDTQGGTQAGYTRWNRFVDGGLKSYAKKRNNALADGVSRMSAYLHFGMVSPMRLAREAADIKHEGAEKYLDELLIWRELAYCFCHYTQNHNQWSALPEWARETLESHASDQREAVYSWEQLQRGETKDALWNAAQKSLLIHGELHNNVRMTWGKAILNWTTSPKKALELTVDLNHRYALDGRDPASYGGILWCFGQFDRPFQPEDIVIGTVRPRPLDFHAQRLDAPRYAEHTSYSRCPKPPKVAVVGAGMSGSIAARTLKDHGLEVAIFEKSRGAGGRMSTRRTDWGNFDHGAQYFTARDPRFRRYVDSWVEQGIVEPWNGAICAYDQPGNPAPTSNQERFVGVPGMNAIAKHITSSFDLQTEQLVATIKDSANGLELFDPGDRLLGEFDRVVISIPSSQSAEVLREFPLLSDAIGQVTMNPCWAAMCSFQTELPIDWSGAFVNVGPIRWISRNHTKPGRDNEENDAKETVVLHANADWSREHLEMDPNEVSEQLVDAFWNVTGLEPQSPVHKQAHRWRFSIPNNAATQRCFTNEEKTIIACGDWAGGPRVEGAFLSGCAAAGQILGSLELAGIEPNGQLSLF